MYSKVYLKNIIEKDTLRLRTKLSFNYNKHCLDKNVVHNFAHVSCRYKLTIGSHKPAVSFIHQ